MRTLSIPQIRFAVLAATMVLAAAGAAQQPAPRHPDGSAVTPQTTPTPTNVTTTGGTNGYVPVFTGTSTVVNSIIEQYNGGIGIGRAPAATLDVNGKSIFRGGMDMSRLGDATPTVGATSSPLQMQSSVYNSSIKNNLLPYFQLETEPLGNNTASTGATLNFLYYSGIGCCASETGLYINPNGTIHFAAGQTFPGAAVANPVAVPALRGEPGPPGPAGPTGPSGTVGPDIAVTGTVAAARFVGESSSATIAPFTGSNSADDAVVVSVSATGKHSYGVKTSGDIGISAEGSYLAGQFVGDVEVNGNIAGAGSSYRIDDPLDPEGKTLTHATVSSPDRMNIYNGSVVTDASGTAIVTMPPYFESLNRDFRYQLTVVGGEFAQAIVGPEIAGGAFTIRTDKPNVSVSWQVTGIRQDAWANAHPLIVEEDKPGSEGGRTLHPGLSARP